MNYLTKAGKAASLLLIAGMLVSCDDMYTVKNPYSVAYHVPNKDAVSVGLNSEIVIHVANGDVNLNVGVEDFEVFRVIEQETGAEVAGELNIEDGKLLRFIPSQPLKPHTVYVVEVRGGKKDDGSYCVDYSWTFTTTDQATCLSVTSVTPYKYQANVDTAACFEVTFSAPVDTTSLSEAFVLAELGMESSGTYPLGTAEVLSSQYVKICPTEELTQDTRYRFTVSGVTGLNGESMDVCGYYDSEFKTYYKPKDGTDGEDGKDGKSCTVTKFDEEGIATITCGDSEVIIRDGRDGRDGKDGENCTVVNNENDTYTLTCGTSTVIVKNGKDGTDGTDGTDGKDGESCSVLDNNNGTYTVTCGGRSVVIKNGKDGKDGEDGVCTSCCADLICTPSHTFNGNGTPKHAIYFADAKIGTDYVWFGNPKYEQKNINGVAIGYLTGYIISRTNSGRMWEVDLEFSDYVAPGQPAPLMSPKTPYAGSDTSGWWYFKTIKGVFKGLGNFDGAILDVTIKNPAFQIGNGASIHSPGFGAASWFMYTTRVKNGCDLPNSGTGDINILLNECVQNGQAE
jgi:hypothetical protein